MQGRARPTVVPSHRFLPRNRYDVPRLPLIALAFNPPKNVPDTFSFPVLNTEGMPFALLLFCILCKSFYGV